MAKQKEKRKNDFSQGREFLLDLRHEAFVNGKSKKLYPTAENLEFSLFRFVFFSLFLFCNTSFWSIPISIGTYEEFKQITGTQTDAVITGCKTHTNSEGESFIYIIYEHTVDGVTYPEQRASWDSESCSTVVLGSSIRVVYLEAIPGDSSLISRIDGWYGVGILGMMLVLPIFTVGILWLIDFKSWRKFKRLQQGGKILRGRVLETSLKAASRSPFQKLLFVKYAFISPQGKRIEGSRKRNIFSIGWTKQPQIEQSVFIVYADDDCHMLL